jgi:hypothetical protein
MHRKNLLRAAGIFLCAVIVALALPLCSRAQDTGYISGTVTDKSGAAVVGAEVVVADVGGNQTHTTSTNTDGVYVVAGLPGGSYDIIVAAKGFQKYQAKGVKLDVAQKIRVDVTLAVGLLTQTVEVTGESVAQVETSSSSIGATITGKQIDQLMLNGRNFTQLATTAPGVVNQTNQDEGRVGVYGNVAYAINGGRTEYNNWELDGGDNMDNGSNATLNVYPNVEAIAEFKVLTSNYGAQYGRNGSGTIEVETKSGTQSFHGSAFEYLRNDFFNANEWINNATGVKRPPYKKHDFGYTIGGPIYIPNHYNSDKKKTFFFFSEEWRREKNPASIQPQNVPSTAERSGNFSDLCPTLTGGQTTTTFTRKNFPDCPAASGSGGTFTTFPNNTVTPTAVGTALLALVPQQTPGLTSGVFPAFAQTVSTPTSWREELIRVDHNLTDNYRLTFRYIHDTWSTIVPNPLWGNGTSDFENIQTNFVGPGTSFVARLNANITPTLLNEFVASYTADHIFLNALNNPPPLPAGAMGSIFNNGFGGKLPSISLSGNTAYSGGANGVLAQDTGYFPWNNANPTYTYRDNLTKILGTHNFQMGAYIVFAQKNEDNSPNVQGILSYSSTSAVSTGNSLADMYLGNISSYSQWSAILKYYDRYRIVEPYFNDDWRVTKRLTLNLGLRVSLFGTYRERYRQAFNFNPSAFVPGNAPGFDANGNLKQNGTNTANPLNGVVQCGGAGGSFPLLPGSIFQNVNVGSSSNAGCLTGHLFNPAPRFGFAFDPKGDGKMAIRGGYGIFYEHTNGNEGNTESLEGSAPLVLRATQSNICSGVNTCPPGLATGGYSGIGGTGTNIPLPPLSLNSIPNKAVWPYVQQWNLDIQKELPSHFVVSATYVGSKGTHLTLVTNGNQIVPTAPSANPFAKGQTFASTGACAGAPYSAGQTVPGTSGPLTAGSATNVNVACGTSADPLRTAFPGYSNLTYLRDAADSIYHALQVSAHRTVGDLTLSLAYTYSHSIDDSSDRGDTAFVNAYDIKANRGNSSFDQRHALSVSYVYALPFFKGSGLKHVALGGWQLSGITVVQTGNPVSVTNGSAIGDNAGVGNGVGTGSRPDQVSNPQTGFTANQDPSVVGPLFYNPLAFTIPTALTFGNVGRDTLYLPRHTNFDFGLYKRFTFSEKTGLDFRWENFNLFNHTEYNSISSSMPNQVTAGTFNGTNFMHLTGSHFGRKMQFGLRLYF